MSEGLSGNLAQLPLRDLLRMLNAGEQTGRIQLSAAHDRAEVFLQAGRVVHANADAATGDAAFSIVLGWAQGTFRFEPGLAPLESTIFKPLDQLLTEGARQLSERDLLRKAIPSPEAVPRLAPTINGESVTVAAADWEVLAQIDGTKTVTEVARRLGRSDLETVRVLYRLKQAELIVVTVDPATPVQVALAGPQFFDVLQGAVAAAMGPLAEIVVDDTLDGLGFNRTTLPRNAMSAVVESISQEIRDPATRIRFQQSMLGTLRGNAA